MRKGTKARVDGAKAREDRIETAEQELYEESLSLLRDASYFGHVDPSAPPELPPDEWIEELGQVEAVRRLRLCRAAWQPAKEAPTGLSIAKTIVGAFAKARADSKRPRNLNVTLLSVVPPKQLPMVEIIDEGDK